MNHRNNNRIIIGGFTLIELIGVIVIIGLITILALPPILKNINDSKKDLSEATKEIIYNAASLYVNRYDKQYEKNINNSYCVSLQSLINNDYLVDPFIDTITGSNIDPTNLVKITFENGQYQYKIDNDCVEHIEYNNNNTSLITFLSSKGVVSTGNGIYRDGSTNYYYYYGEIANNYLWYGGHLWRIVGFNTEERSIKLITSYPVAMLNWGANGCITAGTCNKLENSYVGTWLGVTSENESNSIFLKSLQGTDLYKNILNTTYNRLYYDTLTSTRKRTTITSKVSLLTDPEYTKAGEDESYLGISDYFWMSDINSTTSVMTMKYNNIVVGNNPKYGFGVVPVITISDVSIITDGKEGTLNSPYTVITDDIANKVNELNVGDYVFVPTNVQNNDISDPKLLNNNLGYYVRVIDNSNGIKVKLNGSAGLSEFSSNDSYVNYSINTTKYPIVAFLRQFIAKIDNKYLDKTSKKTSIGSYEIGSNYTVISNTTINESYGLQSIGQILSGNDIDLSSTSGSTEFVNSNVIHNHGTSMIWTINAQGTSGVNCDCTTGYITGVAPTSLHGVTPVFYLNPSLKIISGNGTANNPYTLN